MIWCAGWAVTDEPLWSAQIVDEYGPAAEQHPDRSDRRHTGFLGSTQSDVSHHGYAECRPRAALFGYRCHNRQPRI